MSLAAWIERWALTPDGAAFSTPSSDLQPVRWHRQPAMLKVARQAEEAAGGALMQWWDGRGAAEVLASEPPALLLARAEGPRSLHRMALEGEDDAATRILCATAAGLHAPRKAAPPPLVPLKHWFEPLLAFGGEFAEGAAVARSLLASQHDVRPLHGDLHHDNVLDFGAGGWRAIDPKGLLGERAFDFANLLRNPLGPLPTAPGRFARQATLIAEAAGVERRRLLQWTFAYCCLSAVWIIGDGTAADAGELALDRAVATLAATELSSN
jgi:streptomycin 6-kinase